MGKGLTKQEVEESRLKNGSNALTQVEQDPLWKKVLEGFKDPMIVILIVALVVQLLLVLVGEGHWYEAVGIFIAILIANLVAVLSENKQEGKAAELRAEALAKERTKVIRDGVLLEIPLSEVVVGDLIKLQAGDKVPADGEVVSGRIKVDQASLNGETKEAVKELTEDKSLGIKDLLNLYYVYRGTVVCDGECEFEVKVVGDKTLYGELALEMQEDTRDTPLKVKLGILAGQISKFGYIGASIIALAFIFQTIWSSGTPTDALGWVSMFISAISLAVVIVVMAVPEGLPMMISLVLSMNMGKMMKDNVLVRKLNGIETAGGLNILFSDKTGTITEGVLSVVDVALGDLSIHSDFNKFKDKLVLDCMYGIGVNNSATYSNGSVIGGNSTDRALMSFYSSNVKEEIDKSALKEFNAFDSAKKYSSIVVESDSVNTTYIKGAPEKILRRCTKYVDKEGNIQKLSDTSIIDNYMIEQANRSMRLLAVAKTEEVNVDSDLTLVCILSIRDNVRSTSKEAIECVQKAGVQVAMITGDRKETAVAIAKEAGLITSESDVCLTSQELAEMNDEQLKEIMPKLRVVARALPTDKSRLVRVAQSMNLVVGMTGDGKLMPHIAVM